jgi:hypothetical protein
VALLPVGTEEISDAINIAAETLQNLYECKVLILQREPTLKQELPLKSFVEASLKQADDVLLLEFSPSSDPQIPSQLEQRFFSLGNLEGEIRFSVPYDDSFKQNFKLQLAQTIPNLDAHPKSEPLKLAAYFEHQGQVRYALNLYEYVREQQKGALFLHEIDKLDELDRKIQQLRRIVESDDIQAQEAMAVYGLNLEYGNLSRRQQELFRNVVEEFKLSQYLMRFTDKLVNLSLSVENHQSALISLRFRFHPERYWGALKETPQFYQQQRVVYFTPYFPLMNRLQELRTQLLTNAAAASIALPQQLTLELVLTKVTGDELHIPIVANKDGKLLFPNELQVMIPGYQPTKISAGSKQLYEQKGYFVIGSAYLASGQRTQWGLLYDFFGIPEE